MKKKLLIDKKGNKKGIYAKKGDIVDVVSIFGTVYIVMYNNIKFSVREEFLTDI